MSLFESTNLVPPLLRIMEEYYGLGFECLDPYKEGQLGRWASSEYGDEELVLVGAIDAGYYEWAFHLASRRNFYNTSYIAAGRAGLLKLLNFMGHRSVRSYRPMLEAAACNGHIHILDHFGDTLPKYMGSVIKTQDWRIFQKFIYRVKNLNPDQAVMIGKTCDDVFIHENMGSLVPYFPLIAEAAVKHGNTKAITGLVTSGCSTTNLIHLFIKYDRAQNVRHFLNRSVPLRVFPSQSALNLWIIEYDALKCAEFYEPIYNHSEMMSMATPEMRNLLGSD
jgi:hypothetical protein